MAARRAVLRLTTLPMAAQDIAEAERLLAEERYQDVLDRIDSLPASKVLSPRIHFLSAEAAEALGDEAAVELERSLFVLALKGLLATGDGSRGNPYVVCHATDEYDIVDALGCEAARQTLVEVEGRMLDAIVCSDGRELWFDLSDALPLPRARTAVVQRKLAKRRRISRLPR